MKKIGIVSLVVFLAGGCYNRIPDVVISSSLYVIDRKAISLECHPPLQRRCSTATIRLRIAGDWSPEPPWTKLRFADGKEVSLNLKLFSTDGTSYTSSVIGMAAGMVDVRFDPPIPMNVRIKRIEIHADSPLECFEILWHDVDLK